MPHRGDTMFTSLMGVPMENSLDLAVVWSLYGACMCHAFWPEPSSGNASNAIAPEQVRILWSKRAHPGALAKNARRGLPAGPEPRLNKVACRSCRTLQAPARQCLFQVSTSFKPVGSFLVPNIHLSDDDAAAQLRARTRHYVMKRSASASIAQFSSGRWSARRMRCTVTSLPGEHLFQASALPRNRMRPAIFHAFGKAKVGAQAALRELELQGWETLPIAILGMPNLPPAWVIETWKPVGGCKFTGYFPGAAGNSALRFCLLLKWRAIRPQATELFPAQLQGDSLSCLPAEDNDADVESVSTPSSNTSARRADRLTKQSNETRRRVVRHLTLVHASPVRNCCHLPSSCPRVMSPSYEGLLDSARTLKHVRMSNCKRLWLTPSVLSRAKKSSSYKPTMTCFVNSKARLCLWKVLRHKCLKPSTSVSKVKFCGSPSCG